MTTERQHQALNPSDVVYMHTITGVIHDIPVKALRALVNFVEDSDGMWDESSSTQHQMNADAQDGYKRIRNLLEGL